MKRTVIVVNRQKELKVFDHIVNILGELLQTQFENSNSNSGVLVGVVFH